MARFNADFNETWDIEPSKNTGFPYTFRFIFDRENNRYVTDSNEDWDTSIEKSGRYGAP